MNSTLIHDGSLVASRARTRWSLGLLQRRFCVNELFGWDTYPDDEDSSVFRVYVPGAPTATSIDLSNYGDTTPGTIEPLWIKWEGKNQTWRSTKCKMRLTII
ncbi:hypothetical protein F5890DRAFT_1550711 [Lentinula detonsa]|uniref:Uncharacterized protein n=1 Tax=Lentinula detonsa TaxID=2804962 RepID=A0AA38Q6X8_9AGAR|nr:hypothetical protein F5890DRAFT_1550711 [Lentinula detonsa]